MDHVRFWSRVGHWFKGNGNVTAVRDRAGQNGSTRRGAPDAAAPATERDALLGPDPVRLESKLRFTRSSSNLDRLAEEYGRVVKLMDAIHHHMATQDERTERMARSLESLTESAAHAPASSLRQEELLETIKDAATSQAAGSRRLEEELSQLPKIADAQRETMVALGRQMESARESTQKVHGMMTGLEQTMTSLGDVSQASVTTLDRIQSQWASREDRLATQLQHQGRRLAILAWTALGLVSALAVTGLIVLLR